MPRIRFIQDPDTGELVRAEDYIPKRDLDPHHLVIGDRHYDGLRATDGTDISTRAKHREYMKRNNLTTMDDFSSQWKKAAQERSRYHKEGGSVTVNDVARVISQLDRSAR
jgi:hypothetical protein